MPDYKLISEKLKNSNNAVVTVFGDFTLDKYLYTDPARDEISVETGLPVRVVHKISVSPGGAGNVANNLCALGAKVLCVGLIADDGEGYELCRCLKNAGADTSGLLPLAACTSTYTKPMQLTPGGYSELGRTDHRNVVPTSSEAEKALIKALENAVSKSGAVLICDQFNQRNLGVVTDFVRSKLAVIAEENPGRIFFADSRQFADEFRSLIVKCNNHEFVSFCGASDDKASDSAFIAERGGEIAKRNGKPVLVTLGEKGMLVIEENRVTPVSAVRVEGEIDICGAGDATAAGFVLGLTLGLGYENAACLGAMVSSVTVKKIGTTGTATPDEIGEVIARIS